MRSAVCASVAAFSLSPLRQATQARLAMAMASYSGSEASRAFNDGACCLLYFVDVTSLPSGDHEVGQGPGLHRHVAAPHPFREAFPQHHYGFVQISVPEEYEPQFEHGPPEGRGLGLLSRSVSGPGQLDCLTVEEESVSGHRQGEHAEQEARVLLGRAVR